MVMLADRVQLVEIYFLIMEIPQVTGNTSEGLVMLLADDAFECLVDDKTIASKVLVPYKL